MRWMLLLLSLSTAMASAQPIDLGNGWTLDPETFEIRETDMATPATGTGIAAGTVEALDVVRAYSTARNTLFLMTNSNGRYNGAGENYGIGASLRGQGSRDAVDQWAWGFKSPGEAASSGGGKITSLNNSPQYQFESRNVGIFNYPANCLILRSDIAAIYTDLGLTDTDLQYTLAVISDLWDAHYFKNGIKRDGTTGTPSHQWGLWVDKDEIDGTINSWMTILYLQIGTSGTPGASTKGDFYFSTADAGATLQGNGLTGDGTNDPVIRAGDGPGSLSIAGSVADGKLRMAVARSNMGSFDEDADWATDTDPVVALFGLTAFSGRFCIQAGRHAQDRAGFSLVTLYSQGSQSIYDMRTALAGMDQDAMAAVIEADAIDQLRGTAGNDGVANIALVWNEVMNSSVETQTSIDGVNQVRTAAGYTAELAAFKTWWATVMTKAQTLLDSSSPGDTINWCVLLPNEHTLTSGASNLATKQTLRAAATAWAQSENLTAGTSGYVGAISIDADALAVSYTYDTSDEVHLGTSEASSQTEYTKKWDAIFDAVEAGVAVKSGTRRGRKRSRRCK